MSNQPTEEPIIRKEINKYLIPDINDIIMQYTTYSCTITINHLMVYNNTLRDLFYPYNELSYSHSTDKIKWNEFKERVKRNDKVEIYQRLMSCTSYSTPYNNKYMMDYEELRKYRNYDRIQFKFYPIDEVFFEYDLTNYEKECEEYFAKIRKQEEIIRKEQEERKRINREKREAERKRLEEEIKQREEAKSKEIVWESNNYDSDGYNSCYDDSDYD